MTAVLEAVTDASTAVAVVDGPDALSEIYRPGCAAVVWRRQPLQRFQDWIDQLDPTQLPETRIVLQPSAVREAVRHSCEIAGTPDDPERALLIDDIAALAHRFAEVASAPYLRMRLDVVTNNACKKFHIDAVTSRLICTYRGTGTQYGYRTKGAEPTDVFTTPTGAPIVLRGTLWPEAQSAGLLHRSPPIAGTGETRLLLVLDPLEDMIDESDHIFH